MSHVAIPKADTRPQLDRQSQFGGDAPADRSGDVELGDRAVVLGGDRRRSHHSGLADHIPDDYGL
jgi:hypothetical protein